MTVEERMKAIDNKIEADRRKEIEKKEKLLKETREAKDAIHDLKDRISDVLNLAYYAIDRGISLQGKQSWGGHEGYDTGLFFSNGWSHLVGIKNREYLGITKGGACGHIDFYTNGDEIFGYDTRQKVRVDPLLGDMERFIKGFDKFESALFEFIDKQCA